MEFGRSYWRTFERGIEKEWLITNGLGGFASSTIIGANTRRYHGLLIASLLPPVNRHLILSKIDETIFTDGRAYNLYAFQANDFIMKGYHYLEKFLLKAVPTFIYNIGDIVLTKKISMVYGKNTTIVLYHIMNGSKDTILRLTPLVNFRDYHHNSSKSYMNFHQQPYEKGALIRPYGLDIDIKLYSDHGNFVETRNCWFNNMFYPVEHERGLSAVEDHYIPGYFDISLEPLEEKQITITATIEDEPGEIDGQTLIAREGERRTHLAMAMGAKDEFASQLAVAADSFIVHRKSTNAKTIIAGYPWFTDWGRDSMIALPGLTLVTRRYDDARQILYTFSKYINRGLMPNMFPDEGHEPSYNSADSSLWFFEGVNKYLMYTGDYEFIRKNIYKVLKDIISSYINGTGFDIKMEDDYLITAGNRDTQLTWMDAKAGGYPVTPRHGKAVEINALWYNALKTCAVIAGKCGDDSSWYENLAQNVKLSFVHSFWNEDKLCLYDVVNRDEKDDSIRPNQIFAVSLSNGVLDGDKACKVVNTVRDKLLTPYGLRTLAPQEAGYKGRCTGDPFNRDSAYHQGTVWTWPMGHFITAFIKANNNSQKARETAKLFIDTMKDHLKDACIGYISEIFDGDAPWTPRGCFAQAWSVAEILRAYAEDILQIAPL